MSPVPIRHRLDDLATTAGTLSTLLVELPHLELPLADAARLTWRLDALLAELHRVADALGAACDPQQGASYVVPDAPEQRRAG